jgi:hypothetical protein
MIEKNTYETIKEKLLEASPPDMDIAWTQMDHLLNEVPLAPSRSILKRLLRLPKIWLNSLILLIASVAVSGAYFIVYDDVDAQTHTPLPSSIRQSVVYPTPIYAGVIAPIKFAEDFTSNPPIDIVLNPLHETISVPHLASLGMCDLEPMISVAFESNSINTHSQNDMAYGLPMIKTWGVNLSLGAFPEVSSSDLLGQVGASIWTKRMKYGFGWTASFGYNPVSVRSFDRVFEQGEAGSSFFQRDSSYVSRLNFLSTTLGIVKQVNPRLEIDCGMQVSKLLSLFENRSTELTIDGTTTWSRAKNISTTDFRGIRPYDVGLYMGARFGKGPLKIDVTYRQSLRDFTLNDEMKNPAFNTHANFRFGLNYTLGYKQ